MDHQEIVLTRGHQATIHFVTRGRENASTIIISVIALEMILKKVAKGKKGVKT